MDKTTGLSVISQLSVFLQYFSQEDCSQHQELLDLINCTDKSANGLTNAVAGILKKFGIEKEIVAGFLANTNNVSQSTTPCLFF